MPLSNIFSNWLNNFINNSDKKNVISYYQNKNAIDSWLLAIRRSNIVGPIEIEEKTLKKNQVAGYFKMEEKIKDINKNISNISFLY